MSKFSVKRSGGAGVLSFLNLPRNDLRLQLLPLVIRPRRILRAANAALVICALCMMMNDCFAAKSAKPETRCGWFDNPTPGNAWLHDRDGEWTIAIQGNYEAEGDWPQFKDSQRMPVNGPHGYGCACIKAIVNAKTRQVISITSARARPLSACRKDPALKEPAG